VWSAWSAGAGVVLGGALLASAFVPAPARAGELVWDGFYRARGEAFDSLSLSDRDGNPNAEGASSFIDHRFTLRPTWNISEHAALHAQLDLFAYTVWGDTPDTFADPVSGATIAMAEADGVTTSGAGIQAIRAWGEVFSPIGRVAVGRMPMQWGAGILWNDGNQPWNEHGDTADRIQLTTRAGPVFVMGAYDVQYEGFLGDESPNDADPQSDDMQSVSLAVGYRSETAGIGLLNNYRYQPSLSWQAYTGDLWGFAQLGPVRAELEAVGIFGAGDLDTGANDVSESAFGVMLKGDYSSEKLGFGVEAGLATGDADPTDTKIHTFTFDRDHDVALMLFEEPMPTLATTVQNETNGGRTTAAARSVDAISNALYIRPSVRYKLLPELEAEAAWITATRAKSAATSTTGQGYGNEIDLSLRYDPYPHVWVKGTFGAFLPGKWYSDYEDTELGANFEKPALGGRVIGTVEF
jgi:hypothetical protein